MSPDRLQTTAALHDGAVNRRVRSLTAALMGLGLLAAACSSSPEPSPTPTDGSGELVVQAAASYELLAGRPIRFIAGVLLQTSPEELLFVSFGTVHMRFGYMGTREAPISPPEPGPEAEAVFLQVPGEAPPQTREQPAAVRPSEGRGVYAAYDVTFDRAGFWQVEVTADIEGLGTRTGTAAFEVLKKPFVPAPGEPALPTENLTVSSTDAPRGAIDSRATTGEGIPDPELHRWTIARAIAEGRPALVVFATPVFCISKFCGPVTDVVQELAGEYADRAVFIHIEIWRDFQNGVINKAAADWLLRNDNLNEPWLFLIGADGTILQRWDNLFTKEEVEGVLQDLPPMD